jgi:hypothetical protein
LIINNPQYEISNREIEIIESYVDNGMSLMVLGEALKPISALNKLTKKYGLEFENNYLFLHPKDPRVKLIGQDVSVIDSLSSHEINQSINKQSSLTILFPQTRSISILNKNKKMFQVYEIASSRKSSFAIYNVKNILEFKKKLASDLEAGDFILSAISQGMYGRIASNIKKLDYDQKKVSVAMFGSSKFINNIGIQRGENIDLFMNTIGYLTKDKHLLGVRSKKEVDYFLRNTSLRSSVILMFISYLFPVFCCLLMVLFWYRRKVA